MVVESAHASMDTGTGGKVYLISQKSISDTFYSTE